MISLLLFLACPKPAPTPEPEPAPAPKARAALQFQGLDLSALPELEVAAAAVHPDAAEWATPNTGWHPLRAVGEQGFGALTHPDGSALMANRDPFTEFCNEADFNALIQHPDALWLVTHFECSRGALGLTRLEQDDQGLLSAVGDTSQVTALEPFGGVYTPCSGQITSWGTHLSSEEYEPDARVFDPQTLEIGGNRYWNNHMPRAFRDHGGTHPYRYGWTPELSVAADGSATGVKHYSMGRFSHEIALVLDDDRSVYLSDDQSRGAGFFLFVADSAQDLSVGSLYAAKWEVEAGKSGGDLSWIPMGHASDEQLSPYIEGEQPVVFTDLFVASDPGQDGLCASGELIHHLGAAECLAWAEPTRFGGDAELQKLVAGRLETRRVAALIGATVELEKGEGIAYLPELGELYMALSASKSTMTAGSPSVPPAYSGDIEQDTLALPRSECGGVYGGRVGKGSDADGEPIPGAKVLGSMSLLEGGAQAATGEGEDKVCPAQAIANPDNLQSLSSQGIVFIGEDTGLHANNLLWAWWPGTRSVDDSGALVPGVKVPVLSTPRDAEITGFYWYEIGDYGYLIASVQHPRDSETDGHQPYSAELAHLASVVGYYGPFKLR